MPPNRQEVASIVRTLSTEHLAGFVQTAGKFPPLTSSREEAQRREEEKKERADDEAAERQETADDAKPSFSEEKDGAPEPEEGGDSYYWDWPPLSPRLDAEAEAAEAEDLAAAEAEAWSREVARRRAIVADVLAEDEARDVLSTDRIEANLKRDAERRSREAAVATIVADEEARRAVSLGGIEANLLRDAERRRSAEEHPVINSEEKLAEQEEEGGYWDWGDENDASSAEENAAAVLGASHIEEMLKRESRRIDVHARVGLERVSNCGSRRNGNYWEWRTLTKDQEKVRIIESILEDERARLLLQASHLEANLEKDAARTSSEVCRGESKEDYWSWTGSAAPPHPNVEAADAVASPAPSPDAYWDWSPSRSKGGRQGIVDSILRDEAARQALRADHLVENLKADTWRRAKEEVDACYHRREAEVRQPEAEELESYWDM